MAGDRTGRGRRHPVRAGRPWLRLPGTRLFQPVRDQGHSLALRSVDRARPVLQDNLSADNLGRMGTPRRFEDRKSVVSGKRVSVRVDLGGRHILKKKKTIYTTTVPKEQH